MATVTIRNLSEEAHRALKVRAAQQNRSAEAEMRAILEAAVRPAGRLRLGTALAEIGQKRGVTRSDVKALEQVRDTRPAEPMNFE
ncbi:MAG: plasmid stabilization protein [Burkholderiales bacterium]|jgi:plasmid stability protein